MTDKHLVWDLPLRLFHWLFSITVLASWYTSDQDNELIEYHLLLGYFALFLLLFRVTWGFIGSKHSRFSQFTPSPRGLMNYIKNFNNPDADTFSGHNPLGSLMVFLMIILIILQAVSGLFINDDIYTSGPYYGSLNKFWESVMFSIHHNVFDYMLAAIAIHLIAIAYYWRVKKQNLVLPMITGKKSAKHVKAVDRIKHSKIALAIVIALLSAAIIYWLVIINVPVVEEYYY